MADNPIPTTALLSALRRDDHEPIRCHNAGAYLVVQTAAGLTLRVDRRSGEVTAA